MKIFYLFYLFLFIDFIGFSQFEKTFSYHAIVRNESGILLQNQNVGIKVSILEASENGPIIYSELNTVLSDNKGFLNFKVGTGSNTTGSLDNINWSSNLYFIKLEYDLTGGNNYTLAHTTQIQSVPYALFALNTDDAGIGPIGPVGPVGPAGPQGVQGIQGEQGVEGPIGEIGMVGPQGPQGIQGPEGLIGEIGPQGLQGIGGFEHFIGEYFQGGIIFYLYKDNLGVEHGYIVSIDDVSESVNWFFNNLGTAWGAIGTSAQSYTDGLQNTLAIISNPTHVSSAAKLCNDYVYDGYSDWYLPAIFELSLLYNSLFDVNRSLAQLANSDQCNALSPTWGYWSSTERASNSTGDAHQLIIYGGSYSSTSKNNLRKVRAIRKF